MKQLKNYENYRFMIMEYWKPRQVYWDNYPWHIINYVQEGHGILKTEDITLELNKGDLYYIPMGLSYSCQYSEKHTRLRTMGFRVFPDAEVTPFAVQKLPREFAPLFSAIHVHMLPDAETLGKFYTVLGQLVPSLTQQGVTPTQKLVDEAKKLMSGLYLRWSIARIAQELKVSEPTLYLAFKKVEGRTPNEVRHEYIMKEAVRMLTNTSNSISRISEHLGFSSDTYFRKVFKDYTGKSPRQVRKESL